MRVEGQASCKVGLMCVLSTSRDWPEAGVEMAEHFLKEAREAIETMGLEVIDPGEITRSHQQAQAQAKELSHRGAEVLVFYVASWIFASAVVAAADAARLPVIVWTNARRDTGGLIGAGIAKGSLDEVGIDAPLIYGDFDDQEALEELRLQCTSRSVVTKLRGQTYGICGGRSMGMYTAVVDPNEWRVRFGIETEAFDQLEVVERARAYPDQEARRYLQWIRREFGKVEVEDEVMLSAIKLYLVLKEIIVELGLDFLSVKCLPEMPPYYTTFCFAHAILNDGSDADGDQKIIVCGCENDANGALTMQIMHLLTDQITCFSDVRHLDLEKGILTISNCGSQPTCLARSRKDVFWVPHGIQEHKMKMGAACPQYICKPGEVTLARLSRINGEYVMLIAGGEALDFPREKLRETFWEFSPHAFVRLKTAPRDFVKVLRSNHIHMVYGDHMEELKEICRALKIAVLEV